MPRNIYATECVAFRDRKARMLHGQIPKDHQVPWVLADQCITDNLAICCQVRGREIGIDGTGLAQFLDTFVEVQVPQLF